MKKETDIKERYLKLKSLIDSDIDTSDIRLNVAQRHTMFVKMEVLAWILDLEIGTSFKDIHEN